ncbi:MAG TPA: hypothetical protein VG755_06165 [Nannocystaceae bacterium]|nr:hypothetical protein [Nannocystaceae bacterium]
MTSLKTLAALALATGCVVSGDAGALTTGDSSSATTSSADTTSTTADATSSDTNKLDIAVPDVDANECASVTQTTTIEEAPSDILIVVASTMDEGALGSIFQNFAQLIANDAIEDLQVAMLAGYPPDGICIDEPPLGVQACPMTDDNPPLYRHFDQVVAPDTLLQQVLDGYPQWSASLRPDARTHVFVVSSSDATLDTAQFDAAFADLDPKLSGYVFHAIAPGSDGGDCGVVESGATWAVASGYAALAAETGGVFEDGCNYNVGTLFEQLLDRITAVALSCEYDIPAAPDGMIFEQGKVNVDYDDGFGVQTVGWVESAGECASVSNGWYYDDLIDPQQIVMCPQTCSRFEALQEASIEIRFGCTTIPAA